jgi:hypothetical protein
MGGGGGKREAEDSEKLVLGTEEAGEDDDAEESSGSDISNSCLAHKAQYSPQLWPSDCSSWIPTLLISMKGSNPCCSFAGYTNERRDIWRF